MSINVLQRKVDRTQIERMKTDFHGCISINYQPSTTNHFMGRGFAQMNKGVSLMY